MTDYWVSSKKHYCETCNVWISGHKVNIKNHEKSARHIENFKRLINESFKRKEKETQEKEFLEKELRKLDDIEKKYLLDINKKDENDKSYDSYVYKHINDNKNNNNDNNIYNNNNNNNICNNKYILMIHEDNGSLVFFNILKKQLFYDKPADFYEPLPEYQTFSEQYGWYKYLDNNSNNFYYFNIYNSKSIWEYSSHNIDYLLNYLKKCEETNLASFNQNYMNKSGNLGFYYNNENIKYDNMNKRMTKNDISLLSEAGNNKIKDEEMKLKNVYDKKNKIQLNIHMDKKNDKSMVNKEKNNFETVTTNEHDIKNVFNKGDTKKYEKENANINKLDDEKKEKLEIEHIKNEDKNKSDDLNEKGNNEMIITSNDETSKPGEWEIVEGNQINNISNEHIEEIFYNIKSKEEREKDNLEEIKNNIRYEYSSFNEFYVTKKELDNEDLFLSKEFEFVDKPIYKKVIDKNANKKVDFAKRTIKAIKNKKKIT
ncbi:U1 small nuclear ribonucleoprotein C, putative [Plasmodium sp. gorilla clade G2]|uniref:U1 small nuclear ribonucleoprotein C, putative n=1 Tax=Plasmodium sp. gorilla clade G2 TaxID=880535 RepID=UPI000D222CC4|nr:U1 small nuclear ribonucleoprotein C, putative [Plasmodium sp. gorilla clade G2]SOV18561.1 U1 small nuclear ribonucleoprotein C, putative [Plasmodium sp. gorilla clade G2]